MEGREEGQAGYEGEMHFGRPKATNDEVVGWQEGDYLSVQVVRAKNNERNKRTRITCGEHEYITMLHLLSIFWRDEAANVAWSNYKTM